MQLELWTIGKNEDNFVDKGVKELLDKIQFFHKINFQVFKNTVKGKQAAEIYKKNESEIILGKINKEDFLVLLDEKGQHYNSIKFAEWFEGFAVNYPNKRLIFLIGGAYGFHQNVYDRANHKISLSQMTFSHQLIRIIFLEQLFRAFTINNNHPYHNE